VCFELRSVFLACRCQMSPVAIVAKTTQPSLDCFLVFVKSVLCLIFFWLSVLLHWSMCLSLWPYIVILGNRALSYAISSSLLFLLCWEPWAAIWQGHCGLAGSWQGQTLQVHHVSHWVLREHGVAPFVWSNETLT
jgi:hypothetical protein